MANLKNEISIQTEDFLPLLTYLKGNEGKLKIFLSGDDTTKPLHYPIKGKRATKTVFMSEKLQFLMKEFCIEREIKIGDFVEKAVIQYLIQKGFDEKIKNILDNSVFATEEEGEQGKS